MKILAVDPHGTGAELGLKPGDRLEALDGSRIRDIIDYRFRIAEERVRLRVRREQAVEEFDLEKEADDDLGLTFEDLRIRKCANDCIFCFVDQNPPHMRQALYFRDGDYRLSFLHGHYITMTNMGWKDLERVVAQHLSPLYISVHATDPGLRRRMFLHSKDDYLLPKIAYLTENGISLHTQIVLCPTWNDGEFLERTLADLHRYIPGIRTIAVVPVGLTRHRDGLPLIPEVDPEYARRFVPAALELDERFRQTDGRRLIFLSDEWFLKAGIPLPGKHYYGDFDQVENGVGQVRRFLDQWRRRRFEFVVQKPTRITIASGTLIAPVFRDFFIPGLNRITNLTVQYFALDNLFYGTSVCVTGLLAGQDIVSQLRDRDLGDMLIMSERILSETGTVTLDDVSLPEMSSALGVPVRVAGDHPRDLMKVINHA